MNNNETVDKVCCEMLAIRDCDGEYISELDDIADRILSAHEREITEKDNEIAKLTNIIDTECNKCGDCAKFGSDCSAGDVDGNEDCHACDGFVSKEVAAKDDERRTVVSVYEIVSKAKDAEIAKLRSLVKELADVAEGFVLCKATDCETICRGDERCLHRRTIALVAKAREVANEK